MLSAERKCGVSQAAPTLARSSRYRASPAVIAPKGRRCRSRVLPAASAVQLTSLTSAVALRVLLAIRVRQDPLWPPRACQGAGRPATVARAARTARPGPTNVFTEPRAACHALRVRCHQPPQPNAHLTPRITPRGAPYARSCARRISLHLHPSHSTRPSRPFRAGGYCPLGSTVPTPCPAGTASAQEGLAAAQACSRVPAGSWSPLGSTAPIPCARDSYNPFEGNTTQFACVQCPEHSSTVAVGSSDVAQCDCSGGFVDASAAASASSVGSGAVLSNASLTHPGGARECVCAAGLGVAVRGGVQVCEACAFGSYKSGAGNYRCTSCELSTQTTLQRRSTRGEDCVCTAAYFAHVPLQGGNDTCTPCPSLATNCSAPGVRLETLPLAAGYWRASIRSVDVRSCYTDGACLGGANFSASCQRRGL